MPARQANPPQPLDLRLGLEPFAGRKEGEQSAVLSIAIRTYSY